MPELWDSDDQMPSCEPCLDGDHENCVDIYQHPKYGLISCGCTNKKHEES